MNSFEWERFAEEVCEFFGRMASPKRLILWYGECKDIPGEALPFIRQHLFREHDTMPVNLPKAVKDGWREWRAANPGRIVPGEKITCGAPGCEDGYIHLVRGDGYYTCVALCDQCAVARNLCWPDNRSLDNLPNLQAQGYRWAREVDAERFGRPAPKPRNIADLAQRVGREMTS